MSTAWRIYGRKGEWVAVDDRREVSATFTTELAAAYWLLDRRCDELAGTDVLSAYLEMRAQADDRTPIRQLLAQYAADVARVPRLSDDERLRVEAQNAVDSSLRDEL